MSKPILGEICPAELASSLGREAQSKRAKGDSVDLYPCNSVQIIVFPHQLKIMADRSTSSSSIAFFDIQSSHVIANW